MPPAPRAAANPSPPSPSPAIFHARHEHGGHPVHVHVGERPSFQVHWPDGVRTYDSTRKLVKALYNGGDLEGRSPNLTFERYFRTHKMEEKPELTVFDLFAPEVPQDPIVPLVLRTQEAPRRPRAHRCPASAGRWYRPNRGIATAFSTLALFGSLELAEAAPVQVQERPFAWADPIREVQLSVVPAAPTPVKERSLSIAPQNPLGVDLAVRGHEVRKLLYKGFGYRIHRRGFDIEDVLQEVYRGLLARNKGKCPFDPTKSSFGHYVHMVCGCILSNYERKMNRRREFEQVGMYAKGVGTDDEYGGHSDAALGATTVEDGNRGTFSVEDVAGTNRAFSSLLSVLEGTGRPEADLAARCLPYVYEGYQRAEIARELGEDTSKVGRALAFLRATASEWKATELA